MLAQLVLRAFEVVGLGLLLVFLAMLWPPLVLLAVGALLVLLGQSR